MMFERNRILINSIKDGAKLKFCFIVLFQQRQRHCKLPADSGEEIYIDGTNPDDA